MWLFIPNESCRSVPASAGSMKDCSLDSPISDSTAGLWLTLSGMPTQRPFSWRGWKNRVWSQRLLQTASRTLTSGFADSLTSWLLAFPASRGAAPDSKPESTTNDGCGPRSWTASGECNRRSFSLRMCQASFPEEDSIMSSQTLPKTGSMRSGVISPQKPLALRTAGNESSSWATPVGYPAGGTPEQFLERKRQAVANGSSMGICLSDLNLQTQNWPSRRAEDSESCGNHPEATDSLTGATGLWQTPQLPNGGGKTRGGDRKAKLLLEGQASFWATPKALTGGANSNRENRQQTGGPDLQEQAKQFSPQAQAQTGEKSPKPSGRRLNPAFVCWLMGAPWFWTRAEPISCGAQATAAWRCNLRSLLSNLCVEAFSVEREARNP